MPTLTALRERADDDRRAGCSPRTRAAGSRSPSATASASRRSPAARSSSACCTSRRCACSELDAERRHARLPLLRELFGLDEPAAAERTDGGEVRPLRRRADPLTAAADRHARQRAGARAGALGGRAARGARRDRRDHDLAATGRAASATSRAGSTRIEAALVAGEIDLAVHSAKDVPGELADGLRDRRRRRRARTRATRSCGGRASLDGRSPAGARRRHERRCGGRRAAAARAAARPRGRRAARQRRHAAAQARRGRGRRDRARAPPGWSGSGCERDRRRARRASCPRPGRARWRSRRARTTTRARRRSTRSTTRTLRACLAAERALARASRTRLATRRSARIHARRRHDALRAFVGLPDGSAWLRDELGRPATLAEALAARRRRMRGRADGCCAASGWRARRRAAAARRARATRVTRRHLVGAGPGDPGLLTVARAGADRAGRRRSSTTG